MSRVDIETELLFEGNHVEVHGHRMHYLDEGDGPAVVFVHGAPTWSYLWRNVIPHVTSTHRAIAPDLIGMGRSSKPDINYDFFDHCRYLEGFIEALDLWDIVLVAHDWGTRYALQYATTHRDNVRGIAYSEAFVRDPVWEDFPDDFREDFRSWRSTKEGRRRLVDDNEFVEEIIPRGVVRELTEREMDHYREPFRDPASREMILQFPRQHPIGGEPADVSEAVRTYHDVLADWDVPKLLFTVQPGAVYSDRVEAWARSNLSNLEVAELGHGYHFFPEDLPHAMGAALADWLERLPVPRQ